MKEFVSYKMVSANQVKFLEPTSCRFSDLKRTTKKKPSTSYSVSFNVCRHWKREKLRTSFQSSRRLCPCPNRQISNNISTTQSAASVTAVGKEGVIVLVIGDGGREHALCHAFYRSRSCDAVFCAPGNEGITQSGTATCIPDLDTCDSSVVISFCREWRVGLVVVFQEALLLAGLVDDLLWAGIQAFGPSAEAAAALEEGPSSSSNDFIKKFCCKYGIPDSDFGNERPVGEEARFIHFIALADGDTAVALESVHIERETDPDSSGGSGMGAYSPAPILTKELPEVIMESIILPTVKGMAAEGCPFIGFLHAGIVIDHQSGSPKLIQYYRIGDPELQVLLARLKSDLVQLLLGACKGKLDKVPLEWSPGSALVVVMASQNYPGDYEKGSIIRDINEAESIAPSPSVRVFHGRTSSDSDGNLIAGEGSVLNVIAKGENLEEARRLAYDAVENIDWPEGFCRKDI